MILKVTQKKAAISQNLKGRRRSLGLTQKDFPGVSFRTIQNIEAGISDGGASELAIIADKLGVSVDDLIGRRGVDLKEMTRKQALNVLIQAISILENPVLAQYLKAIEDAESLAIDLKEKQSSNKSHKR